MASQEPIENVFTKEGVITKNALFTIYKAEINLDKFDYDMLYAYTQVNGLTLKKRALEAEKFAQKLSEKNLDNQTIRTILETQNISLPPKSATFIESVNSFDPDFFHSKHNLFLYTQHPNLITVYASGLTENKVYVATESLEKRMPTEKLFETFTQEGKINLLIQVSRAVASLHSNKIIHQNICPENIFALPQPNGICQIKLLASGIIPNISSALDIGGGSEFKPLFAFTSPGILQGKETKQQISEKEDIYALGGVLYFYLSGQRPWQKYRTLFDIITACKNGEKSLLEEDFANIADNLKSVIIKATQLNPQDRYHNIAELIADLEACRDGNNPKSLTVLQAAQNANPEIPSESESVYIDESEMISTEDSVENSPASLDPTPDNTDTTRPAFKSEQTLTEDDLPQPYIQPEVPDINEISPELNKTGSKIWLKLGIAACIIAGAGGIGYYFMAPETTETEQKLLIPEEPATIKTAANSEPQTKLALDLDKEAAVKKAKEEEEAKKIQAEKERQQQLEEEAENKRKLAEQQQLAKEYQQAITAGNDAMKNKQYAQAIAEYTKAGNINNTSEAAGLLDAAKLKRKNEETYEKNLTDAQTLLNDKKLEEAEALILQAKNIKDFSDDPRADQIIDHIRKIRFEDALAEGEDLLTQEKYEEAELSFAWALSIPGYENNEDAANGRKLAQDALKKAAQEQLQKEEEERKRKTQYNAAFSEAEKLMAQKRWSEAAAAYAMALEVPGYTDNQDALNGKQTALEQKEQEEKRLHEAKQTALNNEFNRLLNNANIYLNAQMWREAEQTFSKALEVEGYSASQEALDGRNKAVNNSRLDANREQYDNLMLTGMKNINSKDFNNAAKSFRDALLIPGFDNTDPAKEGVVFAEELGRISTRAKNYNQYIDSGKDKLLNKDIEGAIRDFGKAIVEAPNQIDAYILRGSAYLQAGDTEKALGNFNQALNIDADYEPAILGQALTYYKTENFAKAVPLFSQVAANTKTDGLKELCDNILGWIYLEVKDSSKNNNFDYNNQTAKEYYEKEQNNADPIALNNLGYMYIDGLGVDKDYDTAVQFFEKAAAQKLPEAQFNLGMAYYQGRGVRRNYEEAFKYFNQAAQSNTLPIAWGQLAEMYRRGRGVDRNRDLSREYAEKFDGNTNRDTIYLASTPKLALPLPVKHLPEGLDTETLAKYFNAFYKAGNDLKTTKNFTSARRLYTIASMIQGYQESPEIKQSLEELDKLEKDHRNSILAAIKENKSDNEIDDLLTEESIDDISKELAELNPAETVKTDQSGLSKTELEDVLASLEDTGKTNNNSSTENTDIKPAPRKPLQQEISENRFGKEYVKLINIAEKFLSNQEWSMAEQAFRLALALPESPDQGDAQAGLKTAVKERENANSPGSATVSNYAAILGNATALLKEKQWPQAIYLYKSAIDYSEDDDDTLAQIGQSVAEAASNPETATENTQELNIKSDERDIASHNMAIAQAKQFLSDGNYNAAIQMLEIAQNMKGFEDDPVAAALLMTAKKMKLENDNSPEAIAARRAKNKGIYDKLIKSGELQISSGNLDGAQNSYSLVLKIPGYEDDKAAQDALKQIEELKNRPVVSAEAQDKYNTLMTQGREALDASDWPRAEDTFRIILSLPEFKNDPDALAGLRAAAQAQNKPVPEIGDVTEDILQNGLIPADADLEAIRRRAEFEALIREGKRQLELKQYEVAEAMFNEALKIKGYENNPDGLSLLNKTISAKPKEPVVKLPVNPPTPENPAQDMQHQASLLLEEGNRLRAQKDFNKALEAYSSGIDLDPNNLRLRINRADTNAGLGKFDIALNDYMKVIDAAENDNEVKSYTLNNVANVYYYGKKDYASAVEFYKKAAELGNPASMNSLGVCYSFAKGVEKDPQKSLEWYTKAAEGGYGNAMLNLGMMYQNGWGIDTNLDLAREWYEKAAANNVPRAYVRLSLMYANGSGVEQDQQKADEYKQKAVELGYTADR